MTINPGWDMTGERLAGHINEPIVKDRVLEVLRAASQPMLLSEIATEADITLQQAIRVMGRLCKKGIAERWKTPIITERLIGKAKGGQHLRGPVEKMLYLYQITGRGQE